jgi:hypothetical protein
MKRASDEIFRREATIGQQYAELVAARLCENGINAEATELTFAETEEQIKDYEDEQDVVLDSGHCVEVKSRNLEFDADPKSFPYTTAFVDTVAGWRKKRNKPVAVVFVSRATDQMLVVMGDTDDQWGAVKKFDRIRKHYDTFHTVPRRMLISFDTAVELIKEITNG